ncbi:MAG TPA: glycoside hydrolase family 38 C-terminal domain-containing protein [Streptosporangiaceae bacterium]|nr:glycoside hydrolase family 38 C-terminal domain-containing protein [Streptosporangiaceae bacterium]
MRITKVESTELFTGTVERPLQVVRVTLAGDVQAAAADSTGAHVAVRVAGPAVSTPYPTVVHSPGPGEEQVVEVGVALAAPVTEGASRRATVIAEPAAGPATGPAARPPTGRATGPATQPATGHGTPDAHATDPGISVVAETEIVAAVPGWTMWMVSHFHYDPVWWNTQAQFTESRLLLPDENGKMPDSRTAFELVGLHLDMALQDPDYKFVLAEIDYLKPYFDTHPERRHELRRLISERRVEIVGGNYNEANTNLTCAESTIRNAIYGIGYQRDVLGADPATAWMLDVFGHDPSYPSVMSSAGLTSSAWARGPFHQWGPKGTVGDNTRMQFPSEFEWMSPDGHSLLTAYMPNHYGAGWVLQSQGSLEAAERAAYSQFQLLKPVAATRNVLLPVGADHVVPCRWAAPIHRDWNERYVWPRFVTALPREFFAAVRDDATERDIVFTTQTRDMNPVYPGKDVSYIDTKQAQRAAETAVMDGERLATLAWLHGAPYPDAALDKAWRQLVYGAHHDAITGTESDQVYLDLLGGWREAHERGDAARRGALRHLAGLVNTSDSSPWAGAPDSTRARAIVVFNTLAQPRDGLVTVTLRCPRIGTAWLELRGGDAAVIPVLAEGVRRHPDGALAEVTITWNARDVPGLGYRTYWACPAPAPANPAGGDWSTVDAASIENDAYLIEADPSRGGGLTRVLDKRTGNELVSPGSLANELVVQEEYDYHPRWNEGPWLLTPKGPGTGSGMAAARMCVQRCPIGSRVVADWTMGDLRVTQETLLWDGHARVDFRTHVDGAIGHDRLLRVRFPLNVPGGLPVYETAAAVIGRPFGPVDTDVGKNWFTLDNPAYTWFGLGCAAHVIVRDTDGRGWKEAIGVAEVITPDTPEEPGGPSGGDRATGVRGVPGEHSEPPSWQSGGREATRNLMAALARQGVTATCSVADGPRYGAIDLDSNLPDVRIALGGPDMNSFTAEVLAAADPAYGKELARRLDVAGAANIWVPAAQARGASFVPGADVTGCRDLPVLIIASGAAADLGSAVNAVTADLASAEIEAGTPAGPSAAADIAPLAEWSAALLNRGTPGCVVTTEGALNIALMRSCSGWPSGVWIDAPRRTAPDGSSFSWQHWSHTFEYALVSSGAGEGDWRRAGFVAAGQAYNHPLLGWETGIHPGPPDGLPAGASLLPIEVVGAGDVVLGALKPRGNPAAAGPPGRRRLGAAGAIIVRLREPSGQPVRVRLGLPVAPVPPRGDDLSGTQVAARKNGGVSTGARLTNLLEEEEGTPLEAAGDNAVMASVPPSGTVTLLVAAGAGDPAAGVAEQRASEQVTGASVAGRAQAAAASARRCEAEHAAAKPAPAEPAPAEPAPAEPAQPVFTRYWLHSKGPAPAGNLPVAVHVSPGRTAIPQHGAASLRVTVSAGRVPATGTVHLDIPDGLAADVGGRSVGRGDRDGLRYDLPSDGFAAWDVNVRPTSAATPPGPSSSGPSSSGPSSSGATSSGATSSGATPPGRYFLAARISDPAGQVLEDVATIAVGEAPVPPRDTPLGELLPLLEADERATAAELEVTLLGGDITLAPGEHGELRVRLINRSRSQIRGEAQLLSPFGTWGEITPWTQGFAAEPGAEMTARYQVLAPTAGSAVRPGAQWWALVKVCYFGRVRYTEAIRVSIAV